MRMDTISMELIRQKADETDVTFMTRVMSKLDEIQNRPDTRMIMPLPTESLTGLITYHVTILSAKPDPDDENKLS